MVYFYGSVVGGRIFLEDCPLCHGLSLTFVFFCTVVDVVFAKWGKLLVCEFLSMVYFYGSLVGRRVYFGRTVICAMGSLTFMFCCTVLDVVFAKWVKTHSK